MQDIPDLLIRLASAYYSASQKVYEMHGDPEREEQIGFTTTFYFPDTFNDGALIVEIALDLEEYCVLVVALNRKGDEDCEPAYIKVYAVG